MLEWRERVTKALEAFRAEKRKSVDARVELHAVQPAALHHYASELADLFIVSDVTIHAATADDVKVSVHSGPRCERCWKHYDHLATSPNDVCERCAAALAARQS